MIKPAIYLLFAGPLCLLQAQPAVAPSPDRAGSSEGTMLGPYNVTNTFELGYRFSAVGGDQGLYRSNVNYGNGLRLLGTGFTANSQDGHGALFDSILLNTEGLGNDPYGFANLRIEKNDRYRYDMTWRQNDYYNPAMDNGASANLMNTHRVMQDHDLSVTLARWAKLRLGYSRNKQTGPQFSTYEMYIGGLARTVLPIDQNVRRDWNEFRVGADFDFLGFRLTLSHDWDYYKEDTSLTPFIPGQPYPLPLSQPYQPALAVTYPLLGTSYSRSQPMHGRTPLWFGNLNKTRTLWALNLRMTYSKADYSSYYYESETGASAGPNAACRNCGAGAPAAATTFAPGTARQPFAAADATFSLFPTSKLTIVNSASAQNNRYDSDEQAVRFSTAAATTNVHWYYGIVDKRVSDALDLNYRATNWLGLNAEYRYTDRRMDNDLRRQGTTNNKDINILRNHMNTGTFGVRLKPLKPLSLDVDTTIGRDNSPETPTAPAHFHNIRARVDYHPNTRMRFGVSYRQIYNLNEAAPEYVNPTKTYGPAPPAYFASHSRDFSASATIQANRNVWLDLGYNKLHLDTFANLWIEQPAVPTPPTGDAMISVPGYTSSYVSNIHTVSAIVRGTLGKRATVYAGYNITRDTGDGRAAQDLGLTNPAAAYLAGFNTFPMTYQAPMARVSITISPKLKWNGGWEFYRYNQKFSYFGYQPYYRAQTGYTSLSFAF